MEWLVNDHLVDVGTDSTVGNWAGSGWDGCRLFCSFIDELVAWYVRMTRDPLDGDCPWNVEKALPEVCDMDAVASKLLADGLAVSANQHVSVRGAMLEHTVSGKF